jgi:death-on-curing protein
MRYLTPEELIAIHEVLIGVFGGMRGITEAGFGRLEAAAAAPRASVLGEALFPDVAAQAAALCHAIVRAHPFSDGNKRVALAALDVVLACNGYDLAASNDAAYEAMMALARGDMTRAALIGWVRAHTRRDTCELPDD